jgi:hypothetical protein
MTADTGTNSSGRSGWRKTIVTVAVISALTLLAYREPQYTGEVIIGFLGVIGIHSTSTS